jgi:hypothetical protein
MICPSCASAADLKKAMPDLSGPAGLMLMDSLRERINEQHAACRGGTWCDCQHAGTPSYRQAADV